MWSTRQRGRGRRFGTAAADPDSYSLGAQPRRRRRFRSRMLYALSLGADWVWLPTTTAARKGRGTTDAAQLRRAPWSLAVSPVVCDIDDPDRLAFPLRRGWSAAAAQRTRRCLRSEDLLPALPRCSTVRCSLPPLSIWSASRIYASSSERRVEVIAAWSARYPVRYLSEYGYLHPTVPRSSSDLGGRMHTQSRTTRSNVHFTYATAAM